MLQQNKPFVHLHLHTEYSLLDGACRIDRLMQHIKDMGQTAVAITDHGTMYGCVDFFAAAKNAGIKPIIGCEVYVANRTRQDKVSHVDGNHHLVLLCKNEVGYSNLIKMVSAGFTEGFYSRPRVDKELLEKYSEGLVCLSACLAGEIPRTLLAGNYEKAKEIAIWYNNVFGEGNYYLEIQDHGIEEQQRIISPIMHISKEAGIPLVATNDSHYLKKEDSRVQEILVCIQTGKTLADDDKLEFATNEFYVKSADEMYSLFPEAPEACANTAKIAELCNFEYEFGVTKLPAFSVPGGQGNEEYFRQLCEEGFLHHYGTEPPVEARARLEYEISIISRMGYVNYYLIVADFIRFARQKGIPVGPGRGSGAGSIAAYCTGITGIDPLKYNLLFERFLNPERVSMPDFDIDFCYERRQEVIDYVINKYGKDHVAQIITFGTMAARGAIRDVGRVLDIPYQKVDTIAKMVPMEIKMTLERALKVSNELKNIYTSDPEVRELIDVSMKLEGMPRHASTHAAGVVITPKAVSEYVPLSTNDGAVVTQFPMGIIEQLGLLKMDFLGLRTLTVISDTEKMVKGYNSDFSIEKINFEDQNVYDLLSSGEADGIFQLESGGMRRTLVGLRPNNLEDVIALISLYRPGPMDSIPVYIRNRHNPKLITYKTEQLRSILDVTYGCIVYQEQVMQICRELAGYSYGQADIVRRAMSKKKHDVMDKERVKFIYGSKEEGQECPGCVNNGIDEQAASKIFEDMDSFASYAFNKSHAAAYAVLAYQTAYLKYHYPAEFMAALMTSVLDNTDKIIGYIAECRRLNIKVLPPNINISHASFAVASGAIRYGLLALKNVGTNLITTLVRKRKEDGLFSSLYDFCRRMSGTEINRRAVESFIKSGSFDNIEPNRNSMITALDGILKSVESQKRKNLDGQLDFFAMALGEQEDLKHYEMPKCKEFTKEALLQQEKEVSGLFLSGHPLDNYADLSRKINAVNILKLTDDENEHKDNQQATLVCIIIKIKVFTTKSGDNMAFLNVEDLSGTMEAVVFPRVLADSINLVKENATIIISGRTSVKEEEQPKLIADIIISTENPEDLSRQSGYEDFHQKGMSKTKPQKIQGLFLRVASDTCEQYKSVVEILKCHPGGWPVFIRFEHTGKMHSVPKELWTEKGNGKLLASLTDLLGGTNVASR